MRFVIVLILVHLALYGANRPASAQNCESSFQPGVPAGELDGDIEYAVAFTLAGETRTRLAVVGRFQRGSQRPALVVEWANDGWHDLGVTDNPLTLRDTVWFVDAIAGPGGLYKNWTYRYSLSYYHENYVDRWDGLEWRRVVRARFHSLTEWQGRLMAAGQILLSPPGPIGTLLDSETEFWPRIGPLYANLLTLDGVVYGTTTGTDAGRVHRWDGTNWTDLGLDGVSTKLVIYRGELFAFGRYDEAAQPAVVLQRLISNDWAPIAVPTDATPDLITVAGDRLIVGGPFTSVAGMPAAGVAAWDGANWSAFGGSPADSIRQLIGADDALYGVGTFSSLGGRQIAKWDGDSWAALQLDPPCVPGNENENANADENGGGNENANTNSNVNDNANANGNENINAGGNENVNEGGASNANVNSGAGDPPPGLPCALAPAAMAALFVYFGERRRSRSAA